MATDLAVAALDRLTTIMTTIKIVGAIAAILSAVFWGIAALLGTPVLDTFWDGPPPEVAKRLS